MTGALTPQNLPTAQVSLNPFDALRARREQSSHELDVRRTLAAGYTREVARVVEHNATVTEMRRQEERTDVAVELGSKMYDNFVQKTAGDQAKAEFLSSIVLRGRDSLGRLV